MAWLAARICAEAIQNHHLSMSDRVTRCARPAVRRGFIDGSLDMETISDNRMAALLRWLELKLLRLRARERRTFAIALRRGEDPVRLSLIHISEPTRPY